MKKRLRLVLFFILVTISLAFQTHFLKPRIIVLTDVSTCETDSKPPIKLFAFADMFETEGLVFTTCWSLDNIFYFLNQHD
jgi:hypothetical protein